MENLNLNIDSVVIKRDKYEEIQKEIDIANAVLEDNMVVNPSIERYQCNGFNKQYYGYSFSNSEAVKFLLKRNSELIKESCSEGFWLKTHREETRDFHNKIEEKETEIKRWKKKYRNKLMLFIIIGSAIGYLIGLLIQSL